MRTFLLNAILVFFLLLIPFFHGNAAGESHVYIDRAGLQFGLDSRTSMTGPKMQEYRGTPYWFSIAIHGTPDESNVGKMNSGGCVHLKKDDLSKLIEMGFVKIGTKVTIGDREP